MVWALVIIALLVAAPAISADPKAKYPYTIAGIVIGVTDGDTITVLVKKDQYKIRLNGIDTPEKKQSFGQKAKEHLSSLIFGKPVKVDIQDKDRHGRYVGDVYRGGVWINREMVRDGFA